MVPPMTRAEVEAPTRMAILLVARRGADQEAGLQVLRRGAAVGRGDAHHRGHGQGGQHDVGGPLSGRRQEDQARQQQRGDRHAGDRVGRRADFAGQARRNGDEQEAEHQDHHGAEQALNAEAQPERRDAHQDDDQAEAAEQHDVHRQVALGAGGGLLAARRRWRRSRRPETMEPKISGRARNMLMMPPAATAPAPM